MIRRLFSASRAQFVQLGVISLFLIMVALRFNSFQVGTFTDDAHYIVMAEGIAWGEGPRLINHPDRPLDWAFPIGWPLLLAPFTYLFPDNFDVLKGLSFILMLASLLLAIPLFAKRLPPPSRVPFLILIAVSPYLVGASTMVMSEAAYLFFSLLTIYLFENWQSSMRNRLLALIGIVLIAVFAQTIRTVGASLLITLIAYLVFRKQIGFAIAATIAGVVGLAPQFLMNLDRGGAIVSAGYENQVFAGGFSVKLWQLIANAGGYIQEMLVANALFPAFGPSIVQIASATGLVGLPVILQIPLLLPLLVGYLAAARRLTVNEVYLAVYAGAILLFWNPSVGSTQSRFLIPVIPFLYYYFLTGVSAVLAWGRLSVWYRPRVITVVTALIVLMSLYRNLQDWRDPIRHRIPDISVGASWLRENTPLDAVVMATNSTSHYLYARRQTVPFPSSGQDFDDYLGRYGIDYVLVSPALGQTRDKSPDGSLNEQLSFLQEESMTGEFVEVYRAPEHSVVILAYRLLD